MKTLETEFRAGGFTHRQIMRDGDVAVYERWKGEQPHHFETILVQRHNGFVIKGNTIPPAETYPSAEQWGSKAWTFQTRGDALDRATLLLSKGQTGGSGPKPAAG